MLKETIFAATQEIRKELGEQDWCVSVFEDNAGIVRFDDKYNVVFKVETHNHPSALEPYGGANTGIGGVIRDPLGTGLGAKPVCNTDVFCFAPPDTPLDSLPAGVLHPRRVMKGVVSGVRDYGNRMGIPTVNGALYFDPRYLGNPLVYCGNVGIIPREKSSKQTSPGDWVVTIGGRTGRDGIHGATFSSAELTSESETISGGAVQIGNAITEKMLMDVLLEARDRGLYSAVTDCGAGGFSSAVGEMGEHLGAEVDLEKAPLKYSGLSYTEIWISEAQERMVFSVPDEHWEEFYELCKSEGVEATIIGTFVDSGRLVLRYMGQQVADLDMQFLHGGRPPVIREAFYEAPPETPFQEDQLQGDAGIWLTAILGSLNVASKEWVIRQYDHEVQGGSVLKPLVGVNNDGPGDAAVVRPILTSRRGLVVSCGMNPYYGDLDTYHMAASAIDEALRNCVAVGADPERIAILDNFCWGYTDRAETLGTLVRAALACYDVATAMRTPFISGKDSLNNEFSYQDQEGNRQTISIPSTLLISAMGQVDDVATCVSMDLKAAGNLVYQVGQTHDELGGSHLGLVSGASGGRVPRMDPGIALPTFKAVHQGICQGLIRSCHDLSEGGLAVAAAEMAFAGGLGLRLADPRTRRMAIQFACQWLHVRGFDENDDKNEKLYPEFASLRRDMYEETVLFFTDMFRNDGSILDLLDADHAFLNENLARHYGIPGVSGAEWRRVDGIKAQGRGGLLGMATFLASQSGASRTSPILRGNWVYETLLGERLPRPPADVPVLPEVVPSGKTARQLIELHSSEPACARCHAKIDSYGFALEQFDTIGRLRSQPVDTSTVLFDGTDVEGIEGLRSYLLGPRRQEVVRQFCRKLLGYSLGREVQLSDEPLLEEMQKQLAENDYRFSVAAAIIVGSPQFQQIRGQQIAD